MWSAVNSPAFKVGFSTVIDFARTQLHERRTAVWLTFLLLAAFGLRVRGIGFGLPNLYHPDEDVVVMPAISILKTGDLEPTRMEYGTLHIYLLTAVSAVVFALSARDGQIQDTSQLPIFERGTYPAIYPFPEYFVAARMVTAVMGVGIVLLTYMLARRLGNQRQGLIAATIVAILPAMVANSHYATTDTPVTFWILLGLYLLVRVYAHWPTDTLWAYAGAGFVCGLATATKYNAVVMAVPLLLTPLLRVRTPDEWLRFRVLIGPLTMVAGFLLGTPYALLNMPRFLHWFGYSLRLYNAPRDLPIPVWQWHLNYHLTSPHVLVFILGLVGVLFSFRRWGKRSLIINSFVIVLWAAVFSQTNAQARMWLPTVPVFSIWATIVLDTVIQQLENRRPSIRARRLIVYLPLIILAPLLVTSAQYGTRFQGDDVRTVAQQWIETNIPEGTAVAVDYMPPNLNPNTWEVTRLFYLFDQEPEWFADKGIEYLVMNEALNDFDKLEPQAQERYHRLMASVCLVQTIHGPMLSAAEFDMKIYRWGTCQQ